MTIPIERVDGIKGTLWIENGSIHRLGGPAIEWSDGTKAWYIDGKKVPPFNVAKEKLNEI